MFGDNPKRSVEKGDGSYLQVKNIFKTIQGEGPNVGVAAIFLRLGGCNLDCSFCDTEFEDFDKISVEDILLQIANLAKDDNNKKVIHLVVITGGEPFRQPIEKICNLLLKDNYKVQIETNGTLYRPINEDVEIICSPKISNGKYNLIRSDLLKRITAFKFLISENMKEYSIVPDLGQFENNIPVFIQPMDQYNELLNRKNEQLTIDLVLKKGYRLSYQIHKKLGLE